MATLHIWAPMSGDWRPGNLTRSTAEEHAEDQPHDLVRGAHSLSELEQVFRDVLASGVQYHVMDFHTHAAGGRIRIGGDRLTAFNLGRLRNQRFNEMFHHNARIDFLGCNPADGPEGELLLAEFGSIFLRNCTGVVRGSTGYGLQDPLFTGDVAHPTGEWVTARVRVNGAVTLSNHRYLHAQRIRNGITEVRDRVNQLRRTQPVVFDRASEAVDQASAWFGRALEPSYLQLYWARYYLGQAVWTLRATNRR
jgi:hypothetical protein